LRESLYRTNYLSKVMKRWTKTGGAKTGAEAIGKPELSKKKDGMT